VQFHAPERHVERLLELFARLARPELTRVRTDVAASGAALRAAAATAPPMQPSAPDT
jgi:hypothetical protein